MLTLMGASSGTCEPGCAVTLSWLFNPLATGSHTVTIPVTANDDEGVGCTRNLIVTGEGVHPDVAAAPENAIVRTALLPGWHDTAAIPRNTLLAVSDTALDLGAIALQGVARRLITLRPVGNCAVDFTWDMGELRGGIGSVGTMRVEPETGVLLPGEVAVCQLTYQAGAEALWLEGEIAVLARAVPEHEAQQLLVDAGALLNLMC